MDKIASFRKAFEKFSRTLEQFYGDLVIKFRIPVIIVSLAIAGYFGYFIKDMKIWNDPDNFFPKSNPYKQINDYVEENFGMSNLAVIGVEVKEGTILNPETCEKIIRITDYLKFMEHGIPANLLSIGAWKIKYVKGSEEYIDVDRLLDIVPENREGWERLYWGVVNNPIVYGTLVTKDLKLATIIADFTDDVKAVAHPHTLKLKAFLDKERDDKHNIYFSGEIPAIGWMIEESYRFITFFLLTVGVIVLFLFLEFRNILRGVIVPLLGVGCSTALAAGLTGYTHFRLDPMTITAPFVVLGIGMSHAMQVMNRYYQEYDKFQDVKTACRVTVTELAPATLSSVITDGLGFLALSYVPIKFFEGYAIFCGLGMFSFLLFVLTLMPALLTFCPPPGERELARTERRGLLERMLVRFTMVVFGKGKYVVLTIFLVVCGLGLIGVKRSIDPDRLGSYWYYLGLKKDSFVMKDMYTLNYRTPGANTFNIVFEGMEEDDIKEPTLLKKIEQFQYYLEEENPWVGRTLSLVDYIKLLNRSFHADDYKFYRIPESKDLVGQYLFVYMQSGDPFDFDSIVDYPYRKAQIIGFYRNVYVKHLNLLINDVEKYISENFTPMDRVQVSSLGGFTGISKSGYEVVEWSYIPNFLQTLAVIFVVVAIIFRSFTIGIFFLVPIISGTILNYGLPGFLTIPTNEGWHIIEGINIINMLVAPLEMGVGIDYACYMTARLREEFARTEDEKEAFTNAIFGTARAILFTAGVFVASTFFWVFTSTIACSSHLAKYLIRVMVWDALLAILIMPCIYWIFKPKCIYVYKYKR